MKTIVFAALCAVLSMPVCAQEARAQASTSAQAQGITLQNPRPGVYTAGQPDTSDWKALYKRGIRTVVNLRPMKEMGGRDEAKEVRALGMNYIEVPVFTAADLNEVNANKLKAALNAAEGKPVLVHCASGNRVGGLMAIMAAKIEHMPTEQAIELGKASGMKSSETRVREVLAAPLPATRP